MPAEATATATGAGTGIGGVVAQALTEDSPAVAHLPPAAAAAAVALVQLLLSTEDGGYKHAQCTGACKSGAYTGPQTLDSLQQESLGVGVGTPFVPLSVVDAVADAVAAADTVYSDCGPVQGAEAAAAASATWAVATAGAAGAARTAGAAGAAGAADAHAQAEAAAAAEAAEAAERRMRAEVVAAATAAAESAGAEVRKGLVEGVSRALGRWHRLRRQQGLLGRWGERGLSHHGRAPTAAGGSPAGIHSNSGIRNSQDKGYSDKGYSDEDSGDDESDTAWRGLFISDDF